MLFIGIFGIKETEEELRKIDFDCTGCLSKEMDLYIFRKVLEIFFIPVITLKKMHVLLCPNCRSSYKLKESKMDEILIKGKSSYDDVEKIIKEY
ncbi:zinc-ribbon domain-containing protein [Cetobacterium sp. 8H]|uniref:zinc-ribbon domain-containing protein n=1 Tax=Cetobacterium sp. 8H TaxID=2759681 RepID=UPI00163CD9C4|nr:zinc-ribbon domain-containing protein [Cetobacterium sp. 8H]MBC2850162.1 zinc-ribbon domain-containing protein [Cetobacterium sp. 8H]